MSSILIESKKDPRVLHVASKYVFETRNLSIANVLSEATNKIIKKFKDINTGKFKGAGTKEEAKILQDFFQYIKNIDQNSSELTDDITKPIIQQIIQNALTYLKKGRRKLFTKDMSGADFEKIISAIIAGTIVGESNEITAAYFKKSLLGTASFSRIGKFKNGKIDDINLNIDNLGKNLVSKIQNKVSQKLTNQIKAQQNNNLITIKLDDSAQSNAKIDVSGMIYASIDIKASGSSYLDNTIIPLLQKANFTAKKYTSQKVIGVGHHNGGTYNIYSDKEFNKIEEMSFKLGNTKLDTVFFSLFSENYEPDVILSMVFYCIKTHNSNVHMKLNQLRFIYELTGYGQRYTDPEIASIFSSSMKNYFGEDYDELMRANYFIWNDPVTSTIVVRSTADLIEEFVENYNTYITQTLLNNGEIHLSGAMFT